MLTHPFAAAPVRVTNRCNEDNSGWVGYPITVLNKQIKEIKSMKKLDSQLYEVQLKRSTGYVYNVESASIYYIMNTYTYSSEHNHFSYQELLNMVHFEGIVDSESFHTKQTKMNRQLRLYIKFTNGHMAWGRYCSSIHIHLLPKTVPEQLNSNLVPTNKFKHYTCQKYYNFMKSNKNVNKEYIMKVFNNDLIFKNFEFASGSSLVSVTIDNFLDMNKAPCICCSKVIRQRTVGITPLRTTYKDAFFKSFKDVLNLIFKNDFDTGLKDFFSYTGKKDNVKIEATKLHTQIAMSSKLRKRDLTLHRSFATKLSSILPFHIENIIPSYETIRAYKDKIDASFKEEYKDAHHYNIKQGRFMVGGYRNIRYPSTWTFQHPQIYNNLKK